jgi:hypothetical protein
MMFWQDALQPEAQLHAAEDGHGADDSDDHGTHDSDFHFLCSPIVVVVSAANERPVDTCL